MPQTRIGISGWTYAPWRGTFYPNDLPQKRELEYASRQVNSIEINGSFYSLQTPRSYRAWHDATPDDFVFAVKGSRFITHMLKLRGVEVPLANFFASGLLALGRKLGPMLWQFPPMLAFEEGRFDAFFHLLPRDTLAAARLARRHDARLKGRALVETDVSRPLRHAVEIRHDSFRDQRFIRLLRRHNIAMVAADTAGRWPLIEDVTADFVYVRLHGDEELYVSGYTDAALDTWAAKLRAWRAGKDAPGAAKVLDTPPPRRKSRDVFVYFDNDVKVRAPFDAIGLAHRLADQLEPAPAAPDLSRVTEAARTHWPATGTRRRRRPEPAR